MPPIPHHPSCGSYIFGEQTARSGHFPVLCQEVMRVWTWSLGRLSAEKELETKSTPILDAETSLDAGVQEKNLDEGLEAISWGSIAEHLDAQAGKGPIFLDATFGRGGHTQAILKAFPGSYVVAMDRDPEAIAYGRAHPDLFPKTRVHFIRAPFSVLASWAGEMGSRHHSERRGFHGILLDLGPSSPQLDTPARGFSFRTMGPLDMRMDPDSALLAKDIINTWSQDALGELFCVYGQEKQGRCVARAVMRQREKAPFETTQDLVKIIHQIIPRRNHRDPATKIFQALRMAVNDEKGQLISALQALSSLLCPGGCACILTFHSLEDRWVKTFFAQSPHFSMMSKHAVRAGAQELELNPRASCAQLRWATTPLI